MKNIVLKNAIIIDPSQKINGKGSLIIKDKIISDLINISINQTLSRTVLTSFTTLLALFSLYIFGGQVIKGFTLAMIIGVFIGTYSSTFIASQLLHILGVKRDWSKNNDK